MMFLAFIPITIFLYIKEYKISTLIILFFFLTEGFNLVPPDYFETGMGFSKGRDFAFFILLGIVTVDGIFKRGYFKTDAFVRYIIVFYIFLVACILNSRYSVGLSWSEIIRTARYQFFWMFYFLFRSLDKETLKKVLDICFYVTIFLSVFYMLQLVVGEFILAGKVRSSVTVMGMTFQRYYNQPDFVYFMSFLAIYNNPIKGNFRHVGTVIVVAAALLAFHRSWIAIFVFAVLMGYVMNMDRVQKFKVITLSLCVLIPVLFFAANRFMKSRTFFDINVVLSGNVMEADIDIEDLRKSTFTFRMMHVVERMMYLNENPRARFLGAALVPEDSKTIERLFDFKVGLIEELTGTTAQVNTSDISYSLLFLYYGYLGTAIYLSIFIYLLYYFYKHRHNKLAFVCFMYLILTIGVSFFSDILLRWPNNVLLILCYCLVRKQEETLNPENAWAH